MRLLPVLILYLLSPAFCGAQEPDLWTLERCIAHALEKNLDLKISQNIEQKATYDRRQSLWDLAPSISGWGNSGFDFRRSTNQYNLISTGTAYNMTYGISGSIVLFAGFTRMNAVSASRFNGLACLESTRLAENTLKIDIIDLFSQVLYQKAIVEVAREQLNVSLAESKRIKATIEAGRIEPVAQTEIDAVVSGSLLELNRSENQYHLLRLRLAQIIEIPLDSSVRFASSEFELILPEENLLTVDSIYKAACMSYPSVQQNEFELEYYRKQLQISIGNMAPSLSLSGGYSSSFYSADTLPTGKKTPLGTQFNNYLNPFLGLSLRVPILNGRSRDFQVKKSRLNVENAIFKLENRKKQIRREIEEAMLRLEALNLEFRYASDNLIQAGKSFEVYREKFMLGLINTNDFLNAQNQLSRAKSGLLVSRYSWIVQKKTIDIYMGVEL